MVALARTETIPVTIPVPDVDKLLYGWRTRPLTENDFGLLLHVLLQVTASALPRMEGVGSLQHHMSRRLPAGVAIPPIMDSVALPLTFPAASSARRDLAIAYFLASAPEGWRFMALEYASSAERTARLITLDEPGLFARLGGRGILRHKVVQLLWRQLLGVSARAATSQLMHATVLALTELGQKIRTIFEVKDLSW